jgi:hypothetical protein
MIAVTKAVRLNPTSPDYNPNRRNPNNPVYIPNKKSEGKKK